MNSYIVLREYRDDNGVCYYKYLDRVFTDLITAKSYASRRSLEENLTLCVAQIQYRYIVKMYTEEECLDEEG